MFAWAGCPDNFSPLGGASVAAVLNFREYSKWQEIGKVVNRPIKGIRGSLIEWKYFLHISVSV
jgi:hypothetical protein